MIQGQPKYSCAKPGAKSESAKAGMKTIRLFLTVITLSSLLAFTPKAFGQVAGVFKHREHERHIKQHLAKLDSMDFRVLVHRQWDRLKFSHTNDVVVHWRDGRQTKGLAQHTEDLRRMFAYAPDIRITSPPVMFESDDWTCVIGEMHGTFTKPMATRHGKQIAPTQRPFKIRLCAVGHWNRNGVMDEEYLFWDNQSLIQQIGVVK